MFLIFCTKYIGSLTKIWTTIYIFFYTYTMHAFYYLKINKIKCVHVFFKQIFNLCVGMWVLLVKIWRRSLLWVVVATAITLTTKKRKEIKHIAYFSVLKSLIIICDSPKYLKFRSNTRTYYERTQQLYF